MASIHKDIPIDAPAHDVWDAVRDFGALHTRLVPGFVLDTKLDGDARIVTFANGTVARELLVDCDDARRRLVYAIVSERVKQHSAPRCRWSPMATRRSRLLWIVDVLPHEIAPYIRRRWIRARPPMQKAFAKVQRLTSMSSAALSTSVIFLTEAPPVICRNPRRVRPIWRRFRGAAHARRMP